MNIDVTSNPVVAAPADVRAAFIRRTYLHLGVAILGFIAAESLLLSWSGARALVGLLTGGFAWLVVLAAFMDVSMLAGPAARPAPARSAGATPAGRPVGYRAGLGRDGA